jgi:hypothetical protein
VNHRGSGSSALVNFGVIATGALTCPPILSRLYAGMMQDGLRIAGTIEGGLLFFQPGADGPPERTG